MSLTGYIAGVKGNTGKGISSIVQNADYTITINLTDGTSYTTAPIPGYTDISFDENYNLVVTKTDGTTETITTDIGAMMETIEGYKDDAQTAATNAGNSETNAATSAGNAATSERNAATSEGNASDYADNAQTYAGNASTYATNAYNSASNAATSETNAKNYADNAEDSADNAATSETNAQTYAGNAETSATNAGTSETNAAASAASATASATTAQGALDAILSGYAITETASGTIASITDGADSVPVRSLVASIEPVQSGSGDPSPTNVRPISGWDAVTVTRAGKNLLPSINATTTISEVTWTLNNDGSVTLSGTASGNSVYDFGRTEIVMLKPGTYYTEESTSSYSLTVFEIVSGTASAIKSGGGLFTITEDTQIFVRYLISNGTSINTTIYPQVELGSSATTYESYHGTTVTTSLPSTVYGGTLDVVSGALTTTYGYADLGTLYWSYSDGVFYTTSLEGLKKRTNTNVICSKYANPYTTNTSIASMTDKTVQSRTDNDVIYIKDSAYSDTTTFKTAMSGVQLVYELATPTTTTLTAQEVETLLGANNIYADSGSVSVTYVADLKTYIDNAVQS